MRRAELGFEEGQFGRADPVLAGDGAAEFDRGREDVGERGGDPLALPLVPGSKQPVGCAFPSPACPKVAMTTWCRAAISSMRRTSSGSRERGTPTSSSIVAPPSRDRAGRAQRRAASSASDSATAVATCTLAAPWSHMACAMIATVRSTSAGLPSSPNSSSAPARVSRPSFA